MAGVMRQVIHCLAAADEAATLSLTQLAVIDFLVLANAQVRCKVQFHMNAAPICISDRRLSDVTVVF